MLLDDPGTPFWIPARMPGPAWDEKIDLPTRCYPEQAEAKHAAELANTWIGFATGPT
jgi:hypothetical protein